MSLSRLLAARSSMKFFANKAHLASSLSKHIKAHPLSRFFATDSQIKQAFMKNQVSRVSLLEPRANQLITALRNKDYKTAEVLVLQQGVNVNGHNPSENTPLTDCASRGDTKGVEFLIKNLKANPSASCDCPDHKTALHYAAENGHLEVVKVLMTNGANPLLKTSSNRTALGVSKTLQIEAYLREQEYVYVNKTGLVGATPLKKALPGK